MGNTSNTGGVCPAQWSLYNHKCYHQSYAKLDLPNCVKYCAALEPPAMLPCVESEEENEYLRSTLYNSNNAWIGFNKATSEDVYQWPRICQSKYLNVRFDMMSGDLKSDYVVITNTGQWQTQSKGSAEVCLCEAPAERTINTALSDLVAGSGYDIHTNRPAMRPTPTAMPTAEPYSVHRQLQASPTAAPFGCPVVDVHSQ